MKTKLNNINASSLFHFTRRFDTLQSIVKNGLRFSYAYEMYSHEMLSKIRLTPGSKSMEEGQIGVAIPMISFCDIPITRASVHMDKYGEYAIGFDKKTMLEVYDLIMNPVLYVSSDKLRKSLDDFCSLYSDSKNDMLNSMISLAKKGKSAKSKEVYGLITSFVERKFDMGFILGLIKPAYDLSNNYCYYDEREWRIFWPNINSKNKGWKWGVSQEEYDKNKNEWNKQLAIEKNNYITFCEGLLASAITHIVVKKEAQIPRMIETLLTSKTILGNRDISEEERLFLISKVTSLERIGLDY